MSRSLAFATDLALRSAEGGEVVRGQRSTTVRMATNPTFRWGNFLLVPEAGDPAARLAEHAAVFPGAGFTAVGVDDAHAVFDEGAWLSAGFDIERLAVLTVAHAVSAADTGVRPLRSDEDWAAEGRIALELEDAPDDAHVRFTRLRTAERRHAVRSGRAVWLGVETGGGIVATAGIADAGGGVARFQDVQTSVAHRRRGHASALVAAGVGIAAGEFGSALFVLVAERGGPAIGLYRRLGFREVETQVQLSRLDAPTGLGA
ncbi:MAG: GNAT family N-acetyltransferase [Acidobacteria bacterium]|nr:GNAT family N-acetyltransferase [Acidobacteriota bacterium]